MANSTEMVELHPVGDRPDEVCVGPPVSEHHLPASAADPELHVARLRIDVSGPEPAPVGPVDSGEESGLVVEVDATPLKRITIAIPLLVVDVAPSAASGLGRAAIHSAVARHTKSLPIHANMLAKAKG